jgi:predicted RNA-binding protein with PUA-like domain
MTSGEKLIIYHTGDERTAVGSASVVSVEMSGKTPLVRIRAGKPAAAPKTLAQVKENPLFADSPLVRQGRLSVVPLTAEQYDWLLR